MFSSPPPYAHPSFIPTKKLLLLVQRALQLQTNDRQRNPFNLRLVCGAKVSGWRPPAEEIATRAKQMASRARHGARRSGQTPLRSRYLGQGVKGVQARRASQMKKDGPAQGQRPSPRRHRKRKSERKRQKHREWEAELISFAD